MYRPGDLRPLRGRYGDRRDGFGIKVHCVNKDKEANIFNVAHFGIVADYKEILPALTAKLKELKSK